MMLRRNLMSVPFISPLMVSVVMVYHLSSGIISDSLPASGISTVMEFCAFADVYAPRKSNRRVRILFIR